MTTVYGWIGRRTLRLSPVVLLAYGGLLALTYWVFQRRPDRLHSRSRTRAG